MGTSTDGQLCFGVSFPEEHEFPWGEFEVEEWWFEKILGYKHPFEIYDDTGNYIDGVAPDEDLSNEYYAHYSNFRDANPMPVEVVMHCSYNYPMIIIAAKESLHCNSRGYPEVINTETLVVTDESRQAVADFCKKYCEITSDVDLEPKWYLTSMWG